MKNFDDFIAQIGNNLPPLPDDVYGKVRFRIVGEKYVLPAFFTVPAFILAGVLLLAPKPQEPLDDFFTQSEDVLFIDDSFYSLLD
jgi:hypothetical protein